MDRTPVKPDGTCSAIPGVTSLPDREPSQIAKAGAQALAWRGLVIKLLSIHPKFHRMLGG